MSARVEHRCYCCHYDRESGAHVIIFSLCQGESKTGVNVVIMSYFPVIRGSHAPDTRVVWSVTGVQSILVWGLQVEARD